MAPFASPHARPIWRQTHRWLGLGLGLLLVPIGLSGALLVFAADVDRLLDPARFAVTGPDVGRSLDAYLANAEAAAPGARAATLRWPSAAGAPVVIALRVGEARGGPSALTRMAYLDPPTGRVLGVIDARGSILGRIHSLHADLMVPNLSGRQIVGFIGIGLLALAVTGFWLWRPDAGEILQALWWRRGVRASLNLHHMAGGWIAAPLAAMALTGAYLSFPQQARGLITAFAELSPRPTRQGSGAALLRRPVQNPQRVVELALQSTPGARPTVLSMPGEQDKLWHVQLVGADDSPRGVTVEDATGVATLAPPPTSGDAFAASLRSLHEARLHGPLWRAIGVFCGLSPTLFFITGVMIWLRRPASKRPRPKPGLVGRGWTPTRRKREKLSAAEFLMSRPRPLRRG